MSRKEKKHRQPIIKDGLVAAILERGLGSDLTAQQLHELPYAVLEQMLTAYPAPTSGGTTLLALAQEANEIHELGEQALRRQRASAVNYSRWT